MTEKKIYGGNYDTDNIRSNKIIRVKNSIYDRISVKKQQYL